MGSPNALISVSVANIYSSPDYTSEMTTQQLMGTPVIITGRSGYWNSIITPEGYKGWITDGNVAPLEKSEIERWQNSDRVIVTDYFSIIRTAPEVESAVISDLIMGNIIEVKSENNPNYYYVSLPDGRNGYIEKKEVSPFIEWIKSRDPSPENIVKTSKIFMGFPYVWGGYSIKGFDCSGLIKTTYFLNGIILQRDASQQVKTGKNVDFSNIKENLRVGDLVFFGKKAQGKENAKISHVGLYIGNGDFIHSSLKVKINSLIKGDKNYYSSKQLLSVRRILGSQDIDSGIVSIINHPWYFKSIKDERE